MTLIGPQEGAYCQSCGTGLDFEDAFLIQLQINWGFKIPGEELVVCDFCFDSINAETLELEAMEAAWEAWGPEAVSAVVEVKASTPLPPSTAQVAGKSRVSLASSGAVDRSDHRL